jgi:hypothetical protein
VIVDITRGYDPLPRFLQTAHLTIGPDGSVYVTWVRHFPGTYQEMTALMLRKITPTSSINGAVVGTLSPIHTVDEEWQPIPWKFAPYPSYYRTFTYPHVAVDGSRVIMVWDRRTTKGVTYTPRGYAAWWFDLDTSASLVAKFSDDGGATWSGEQTVSSAWGPQYQPSVCVDSTSGKVVVAYYSHQNDPFTHGQDVYVATSDDGAAPYVTLRVTPVSNDTEDDPRLSDFFIGDYMEVACAGGRAYVHFTANYSAKWFGIYDGAFYGRQQDNFMARVTLP